MIRWALIGAAALLLLPALALAGEQQQPGTGRAGEQVAALARRQVEGIADAIDRLRRLPQQHLGRGIGDHRLAELAGEEVACVLGDGRQPAPALARRLRKPVQELGAGRFAHQQPGLVDEDAAFAERAFE